MSALAISLLVFVLTIGGTLVWEYRGGGLPRIHLQRTLPKASSSSGSVLSRRWPLSSSACYRIRQRKLQIGACPDQPDHRAAYFARPRACRRQRPEATARTQRFAPGNRSVRYPAVARGRLRSPEDGPFVADFEADAGALRPHFRPCRRQTIFSIRCKSTRLRRSRS